MEKSSKILILGASGMVGKALVKRFTETGYKNLLLPTRSELDLLDNSAVSHYFSEQKPEYVILAAAKVGGIADNYRYPADYIFENLGIEHNVFGACHKYDIKRFLFIGSSCIYPKECPQPIKEEYLLTGPLEPTNDAFAIAKIAGLKMAESFCKQYGREFLVLMPTSMYGPHDNFDPETGHVIAGLISKIDHASKSEQKTLEIWGTGTSRREFLFVDDMADACLFLMNYKGEIPSMLNLGTGKDISINELAELIMNEMGVKLELSHDLSRPDGTMTKRLDVSKLDQLGWSYSTTIQDGLRATIEHFRSNK